MKKLITLLSLLCALAFAIRSVPARAEGCSGRDECGGADGSGGQGGPTGPSPVPSTSWDHCDTEMAECLAACVLTWGSCIIVCDAKYVACEQGPPFGL